MRFTVLGCVPGLLLSAGVAVGQPPVCGAPAHRAFDFWLGTWEVRTADGTLAGRNHISSEQQGCVLVERWSGAQGSTGMSQNFYDVASGQWRQVWISPGVQIDIRGSARESEMALEGTISYVGASETFPFRGTWTLLDDGRVRQYFEEAREPSEWRPWFEGFYARTEDASD